MLEQSLIRFLGRFAVYIICKAIAHKMLGSRVLCYTPTVRLAVFVLHINKIAYYNIALRLQTRDNRIKTLVAAFPVITDLL